MNKYILIIVSGSINRFLDKCSKQKIELFNINYINDNSIIVKINKEDLENIKIYNYYSDIKIYKRLGIDGIKDKVYKLKYIIITFIICLICTYFISNIIFKINVISSNKSIRELLYSELEKNGIKKYSYKKSFKELDTIKNKILNQNKDKLEWISITNIGMTYIVRVEERIIDKKTIENEYCDVYSKKDALIKSIYSDSGEIMISNNDIVKKGDLLISGKIVLNEEIKGYTCANGIVIGNVWYNTNISIKRIYKKQIYTGKKRYNFTIKNKILRNNKYNYFNKKYIIKNKLFSLYKELEYKELEYKYKDNEGIKLALKELNNKFNTKLGSDGIVVKTKIINKYLNNKTINLDVFVITEENISNQVKMEVSG